MLVVRSRREGSGGCVWGVKWVFVGCVGIEWDDGRCWAIDAALDGCKGWSFLGMGTVKFL